jgi:hypothetical protein
LERIAREFLAAREWSRYAGVGAARAYDLAVLSELLPAAEAGLVEALSAELPNK